MEMKVAEIVIPESIDFNYEELKSEISKKVSHYETLVYTDDQIKEAKKDRADLNRVKKALNDERIRREKEYMKPFDAFKSKVNEIIKIIDSASSTIDKQVKEYEYKVKADKRLQIGQIWCNMDKPEWLTLTKIFDDKWLNASASMKSIQKEIEERIEQINTEIETISALEWATEAMSIYKQTLDMKLAVSNGKVMLEVQKKKEEAQKAADDQEIPEEEKKGPAIELTPMEPTEPEEQNWLGFKALLTVSQALDLKDFFEQRKITFKPIKIEEEE